MSQLHEMEAKFAEFHHQTKRYLAEIKEKVDAFHTENNINLLSYFTYSLNISHNPKNESLCIGTYHVKNIGQQRITNPYLCIKLPKDSPFTFEGKYIYKNVQQKLKNQATWERMNEKENKEEYWLRPIDKQMIEPNETLSFSNFQIKWIPTESYAGTIMGFVYCDQLKDGITVINPMNLSGIASIQEENDE